MRYSRGAMRRTSTVPRRRRLTTLAVSLVVLAAACAEDPLPERTPTAAVDAGADREPAPPDAAPDVADAAPDVTDASSDGACGARIDVHPPTDSAHVPEGTPIEYGSNPPSSGKHYPVWANFEEYASPVEDGYLVHSMEHGAVLLLYDCDGPSTCPLLVEALRAVRDAVPTDPQCDPSIRVRVILAPRPSLDVPVAAAAWGFTYRADCVDAPSLGAFIDAHYAKAPENFCAPGRSF